MLENLGCPFSLGLNLRQLPQPAELREPAQCSAIRPRTVPDEWECTCCQFRTCDDPFDALCEQKRCCYPPDFRGVARELCEC